MSSLRRVETESRFLRTPYASLPWFCIQLDFLCVLYAEICVNATADLCQVPFPETQSAPETPDEAPVSAAVAAPPAVDPTPQHTSKPKPQLRPRPAPVQPHPEVQQSLQNPHPALHEAQPQVLTQPGYPPQQQVALYQVMKEEKKLLQMISYEKWFTTKAIYLRFGLAPSRCEKECRNTDDVINDHSMLAIACFSWFLYIFVK